MGREASFAPAPAALAAFLPVLLLTLAPRTAADQQTKQLVNDTQCDCFMTNGSNSNFFSNHRFYDFRSLGHLAVSSPPAHPNDSYSASSAPPTSNYFTSSPFSDDWAIMTWNNSASVGKDATYLMVNSPANIYIERNSEGNGGSSSSYATSDTYITMRTARLQSNLQTAAEIESLSKGYRFLSVRMLARTIGPPGACTAIFTYRGSRHLADVQEADIEVLTNGPTNMIQYTNQPSFTTSGDSIPDSTVNATVPVDWTQWSVHRLDWTPSKSTWYVDGHEVASISFQTPRDASRVNLNSWSDGGVWTGPMAIGKEAVMQVQWVEMVFNSTDPGKKRRDRLGRRYDSFEDGGSDTSPFASMPAQRATYPGGGSGDSNCRVVCSIDETELRGMSVVLANGSSKASRLLLGKDGGVRGLASWLPVSVIVLAMLSSLPVLIG